MSGRIDSMVSPCGRFGGGQSLFRPQGAAAQEKSENSPRRHRSSPRGSTAHAAQKIPDTGEGVRICGVAFGVASFDPSTIGLVCVSSNPTSEGFTQIGGVAPVECVHEP
jgi:hypothetical protein